MTTCKTANFVKRTLYFFKLLFFPDCWRVKMKYFQCFWNLLSGFGVGIVFNPLYQGLQKRWWQIWPLPPPVFFTMGHSHTPSLIVGSCMVRQCEAFYRKRVFMFCSVACLFPSPFSCFLQQNHLPCPPHPPTRRSFIWVWPSPCFLEAVNWVGFTVLQKEAEAFAAPGSCGVEDHVMEWAWSLLLLLSAASSSVTFITDS